MTLKEILDKIDTLSHLIGEPLKGEGERINKLVPIPVASDNLYQKFVERALIGKKEYAAVAEELGLTNFEIGIALDVENPYLFIHSYKKYFTD